MRSQLPFLYGLVLRLYPARFRAEYAGDLALTLQQVEDEIATAGVLRRSLARTREIFAMVRTAFQLRGSGAGGPRPDRGSRAELLLVDLRRAARSLLRLPGLTGSIVLTLALAIGVNTALFSVVNAVLLAPLPYPDADNLMFIWQELHNRGADYYASAQADITDYSRAEALTDIGGVWAFTRPLADDVGPAERVQSAGVTTNFFDLMGVAPILGRGFEPQDGVPQPTAGDDGQSAVALPGATLISWELWQRRYGGDPEIVGRRLDLGRNASPIVVGVLPRGFRLLLPQVAEVPEYIDTFHAARIDWSDPDRSGWFIRTIARLHDGATVAEAQAQLEAINATQWEEFPIYANAGTHTYVAPLHEALTSPMRSGLLALFGAVGFVLLIACVNVVNLLLVRATQRTQEVAVRAALGASRLQLIRETLLETGLLAVLGGGAGALLAALGVRTLILLGPTGMPRLHQARVDGAVLGFAFAVCVAVAIACGLAVVLRGDHAEITESLHSRAEMGPGNNRLRRGLVIVEVALSIVLLVGASLMTRSLGELLAVNLGFQSEGVLTFEAGLSAASGDGSPVTLRHQLIERLEGLPGVEGAASISVVPLGDADWAAPYGNAMEVDDGDESDFRQANIRVASPGYFATMQTPFVAGRDFGLADEQLMDELDMEFSREIPMPVIVDRAIADRSWPMADPVGELLFAKMFSGGWMRVVGVVESQRTINLAGEARGTIYVPDFGRDPMGVVVRVQGDPAELTGPVRDAIAELNPRIAVADLRPLQAYVGDAVASTRFAGTLMALFAALAVVLAAIGIYGVMAWSVRSRTQEIGLRMALGATSNLIRRRVIGQGLSLVVAGVAIGEVASVGLTRAIEGLLYGVNPLDPTTYVLVPLVLALTAAVACWLPARRATRIDPVEALRSE